MYICPGASYDSLMNTNERHTCEIRTITGRRIVDNWNCPECKRLQRLRQARKFAKLKETR